MPLILNFFKGIFNVSESIHKKIGYRIKNNERKFKMRSELPFQELNDSPATVQKKFSAIPPVVYQTWVDNLFGKTHLAEIQKFRSINPDLSFFLYRDEEIEKYMKEFWGGHPIYEIFQKAKYGPMKTDIFRYCIIFERGGFYFDINKACTAPVNTFCSENSTGLISFENNDFMILLNKKGIEKLQFPTNTVLQWGFGFTKGHVIPGRVIENICEYYPFFKGKVFENPKSGIITFTGPGMFTKSVHEIMETGIDINIDQAGIDFHGNGVFELPGSWMRYTTKASYAAAKNDTICD
jgi:hypothetical protein